MIRKGQLKRISRDDAHGQAKFVDSLFKLQHRLEPLSTFFVSN